MNSKTDQILVPVNFSKQSLIAVGQSYNLARLTGAEITLIHVQDEEGFSPLNLIIKKKKDEKLIKEIHHKLDELAKKVAKEAGVKVNTLVVKGKVYEEIAKATKSLHAKFVIMGTYDSSTLMGANTFRVVRESICPVITIKGAMHRDGCKNILLPLDMSIESKEKVGKAIEFAKYFSSAIRVVSINSSKDEFIANKARRHLDQVKLFIREKGVHCTAEMIEGDSASAVIKYAHKVEADLIMIMTQPEENITELFIGTAAQQLINKSDIPILSIRPSGKSYTKHGGVFS